MKMSRWICQGSETSTILVEMFHGIFMFSTDVYSAIQSIYCSINCNVYGFFYFFFHPKEHEDQVAQPHPIWHPEFVSCLWI